MLPYEGLFSPYYLYPTARTDTKLPYRPGGEEGAY